MALLDFCTYDDIRAVLGVEAEELPDTTLALELYLNALNLEFNETAPDALNQYATVKALTTRSGAQQAFYEGCRLFAMYATAKRLASSLPLFAPKDITDGKAATGRFSDSPYRDVIAETAGQYERLRLKLPSLLAALSASTINANPRVYFGSSAPSSDPVTGQ